MSENVDNSAATGDIEEVLMEQDHKRGPGWFLIASYVVITLFCIYYGYTHWNWQSDYDVQQQTTSSE